MSFKTTLRFYFLRLRNSSLVELTFRMRQALLPLVLILSRKLDVSPFLTPAIDKSSLRQIMLPNLILSDKNLFCQKVPDYIKTISQPIESYLNEGPSITTPHMPTDVKDIRLAWESARLQKIAQFLVCASHFPNYSDSVQSKQSAKNILFEWIHDNPFPKGIHYTSAMECALRIPVFFYALKIIDDLDNDEQNLLFESIYRHAWIVSKRLSLFSSKGNHTIAESVGLIFAGMVYRTIPEGKKWLETGSILLTRELPFQILGDGGPTEQSLGYLRFILDLYWLAADFMKRNGYSNGDEWRQRLSTGESFLASFTDSNGFSPSIGDSDGGYAIAPGISTPREPANTDRNIWKTYKQSGYTVIRNDSILFTFDHGGLGMAPFFNHGHADALSITLSKNGLPILVDPGTYRYNGVPKWRKYFKGTRAHNTVTIDNLDQACQETSFIWSRPYTTKRQQSSLYNNSVFFSAEHNGYSRLREQVLHRRSIIFFEDKHILIEDSFRGKGSHCFELNYHFHPKISPLKLNDWWVVENQNTKAFMCLIGNDDFTLLNGRENPIFGWYSSDYGKKETAFVLTCSKKGTSCEVSFVTAICTETPPDLQIFKERMHRFDRQA